MKKLSSEDLIVIKEKLHPYFLERKYKQKTIIMSLGERWTSLFWVKKGLIRVYYIDAKGKEANKGFFFENSFAFPIAPQAVNYPVKFSIEAIEETILYETPLKTAITVLGSDYQSFLLYHALLLLDEKIDREVNFLLNNGSQKYNNLDVRLLKRVPNYHLASYLGLTKESLSRIKRKLLAFK